MFAIFSCFYFLSTESTASSAFRGFSFSHQVLPKCNSGDLPNPAYVTFSPTHVSQSPPTYPRAGRTSFPNIAVSSPTSNPFSGHNPSSTLHENRLPSHTTTSGGLYHNTQQFLSPHRAERMTSCFNNQKFSPSSSPPSALSSSSSLVDIMATVQTQPPYSNANYFPRPFAYTHMKEFSDLVFSPSDSKTPMHFLMPNGVLIIQEVSTTAPLAEIKADLWDKAREYPLYGLLHDMTGYHFITSAGRSPSMPIELLDEDMSLRQVGPFLTFLKVIERKGNEAEKILNKDISVLINKNLSDFDALKNPEVNEFRWKMKELCDEEVKQRSTWQWHERVQYKYPCSVDPSPEMPAYIKSKLADAREKYIFVSVRFSFAVKSVESTFTLRVEPSILPNCLMEQALNKFNTLSEATRQTLTPFNKANYIFKILAREEYLVEEVPLFRYTSVQEHLATRVQHPLPLMVVNRSAINVDEGENLYTEAGAPDSSSTGLRNSSFSTTLTKKKSMNVVSSWTVSDAFKVEIGALANLNLVCQDTTMVRVHGGLYHGTIPLCEVIKTELYPVKFDEDKKLSYVTINKFLTFDIAVCDLPRSARLCLGVFEEPPAVVKQQQQQKSGKKASTAQLQEDPRGAGWVNISVFDYRRGLRRGAMTLYCWSVEHDMDLPKPLGTVVSNPDHDKAISVTVTFPRYHSSCDLMYPARCTLMEYAQEQPREDIMPTPEDIKLIKKTAKVASRDPELELFEHDRKRLFSLRWYCSKSDPHILPRLLECVDWNTRVQVRCSSVLVGCARVLVGCNNK